MKAVVRQVHDSYRDFYFHNGVTIDLDLARKQHESYVNALEWLGLSVDVLSSDSNYPDCVFIGDTAVVNNGKALITNLADDYRKGEVNSVREYFKKTHELLEMKPKSILEGGNVLVTDDKVYLGLSKQTNNSSKSYVKSLFAPKKVKSIPVTNTLHLKSACSYLGGNTLLTCPELISALDCFEGMDMIFVDKDESFAVNCISLEKKVLVAEGAENLISFLKQDGFTVRTVPISEFIKGEGNLTCMSIIY